MGLVTLTFDLVTFKLVCKSHLRWGTFLPNFGTLGLWVLKLFAMYATDGQTNRRTKATLIALTGGGITSQQSKLHLPMLSAVTLLHC